MKETTLGDRMKIFESVEQRKYSADFPIIVRIDGKCFHKFTARLDKPFSAGLSLCFDNVLYDLMKETNAIVGYTQSDEISLVLYAEPPSQIYFDGKRDKINSVLASITTRRFFMAAEQHLNNETHDQDLIAFDCRSFAVPDLSEAANYLVWREIDARRNAVQMAGRYYFSHKQLLKVKTEDIIKMLHQDGVKFDESYARRFRIGHYLIRRNIEDKAVLEVGEPLFYCANKKEYLFDNAKYKSKE